MLSAVSTFVLLQRVSDNRSKMAQLHYCFIAVLVILSAKLAISDEFNDKRAAITNEEHIDES